MELVTLDGPRRFARPAFFFVAAAFAIGITIQIFISGLAVFVSPVNWVTHSSFVLFLTPLPLLMLLLAFVGRLTASVRWQSTAILVLLAMLFYTASVFQDLPWLAATHPVIAVVLFWVSVRIATIGWRLAFQTDLRSDLKQESQTKSAAVLAAETES